MPTIPNSPSNHSRKPDNAGPVNPPTGTPETGKAGETPKQAPKQEPKKPEIKDEAKYTNHGKDELKNNAKGGIDEAMDKKAAEKVNDPRGQELRKALAQPEVLKKIDELLKNPEGDYEDLTGVILDAIESLEKPGGTIAPGTRAKLDGKFNGSSNEKMYRETLNRWIKDNYVKDDPKMTPEQKEAKLKNFLDLLAGGSIHICDNGPIC